MAKFKKGKSGNPNGRPKGTTTINGILKKIGSEQLPETEIDKLEFIMRKVFEFAVKGESWAVHFIADRLEGKPKQTIGLHEVNEDPIKVFDIDEVED
tara:strand:+ start:1045 stop:1335 length:291 start_codon:yes stop_codon:yes gene_type:complete